MTTDMQKAPSVARKALNSPGSATPVARYDLSTSGGGRRYIADFFATELRRHDFAGYINAHLAADFACALAQHLSATGKQQVDAVRALPAEWRTRAGELDLGDEIGLTHHLKLKDCADELETALAAALPHLHPQPAELSFDVDAMLAACVPGGSIVDPQVVADNIRAWVADRKPAELAEQQGYAPIDITDPWRGLYQAARLPASTEYGDIAHPDIPCWPDDREDALDKLVHAQGFDFQIVAGEFTEAALEEGDELYWAEMRAWTPVAPPEGEWRLAWKGDTEDGPYAWFVRPMALRPDPVAIAATGKQHVGEVQGDALIDAALGYLSTALDDLDSCTDRRPGIMVTEAMHTLREAIAARQPGAQEPVSLGETDPILCAWSDEDASSLITLRDALRKITIGMTTKDAAHFLKQPGQRRMTIRDAQEVAAAHLPYVESLMHRANSHAAPPAQGIDLGQLWEPIKDAVHTALSAHVPGMRQKRREQVAVYVARQLRDGQRDSAPGMTL